MITLTEASFLFIDCSQQETKGIEIPDCEGIIDLSTGTTGNFIPDAFGVAEDSVNDPVDWEVEGMTAYVVPPYPGWYSGPEVGSIANWITPYVNQNHNYPQGYGDFKATLKFNAPSSGKIVLYYTADDGLDLFLDGNLVDSYKVYKGFTQLKKFEANVQAGQHVITASVEDEHNVVSGFLAIGWFCPEVSKPVCEKPQIVKLQPGEKYQCGDYVFYVERISPTGFATVTVYENSQLVGTYSVNLGQTLVVGGFTIKLTETSENTVVFEVCCEEAMPSPACENWKELDLKIGEKYQCGKYTIVLDNVDYNSQKVKVAVYDSAGNLMGIYELSLGDSISQPNLVLAEITGDNSAKFKICCEEAQVECVEKRVEAIIGQKYQCGDYYFELQNVDYGNQKVTIAIYDSSGNLLSTHTLGIGDFATEGSAKIKLSMITGDNKAVFSVCCGGEKPVCEDWKELNLKIGEKYQCGDYTVVLDNVDYANNNVKVSIYDSSGNLVASQQLSAGQSITQQGIELVFDQVTGDNSARFKICCGRSGEMAVPVETITTFVPEDSEKIATPTPGETIVPAETPEEQIESTPTPIQTGPAPTPGFEAGLTLLGLLAVVYLIGRRK